MKRTIGIISLVVCCSGPVYAQTTELLPLPPPNRESNQLLYSPTGKFAGSIIDNRGGNDLYYDEQGRFVGSTKELDSAPSPDCWPDMSEPDPYAHCRPGRK